MVFPISGFRGSWRARRGVTLVEMLMVAAIGVPLVVGIFALIAESLFTTRDLSESYSRFTQGQASLEWLATELSMSSPLSQGFQLDNGISFSLRKTLSDTPEWFPTIEWSYDGASKILWRKQGGDSVAMMSNCGPLTVTPVPGSESTLLQLQLDCGALSYSGRPIVVSRTVALRE